VLTGEATGETRPASLVEPASNQCSLTRDIDARYGRITRGEAECDDAAGGDIVAESILVRIGNHKAFRTTFGPAGFYYRIPYSPRIIELLHNFTLGFIHDPCTH
jgi:hypothetical protein